MSDPKEFEKYLFDRKGDVSFEDRWDAPFEHHDVVRFSSELFLNIQEIASRYSELQVCNGLESIIHALDQSWMCYAFTDKAVNCNERCHAIRNMFNVFSSLFNKQCTGALSHNVYADSTSESTSKCTPGDEYDYLCYMWWDIFQCGGCPRSEVDFAVIETLEKILDLDNLTCVESGLHGLGHWSLSYPAAVKEIIQQRIERLPAELRDYALKAMDGHVQ